MPYVMEMEEGETKLREVRFSLGGKTAPFFFGVSDRALYLPATRLVVTGDGTYFRRVPKEDVVSVAVEKTKPYGAWVFAGLMVAAGLVTEVLMMAPLLSQTPGTWRVSGWPLAVLVGGFLLPFAAKGRRRLRVRLQKGGFKWDPPMVVGSAPKKEIDSVLDGIAEACGAAGMPVVSATEGCGVQLTEPQR
jgi:hypothetical protein